MLLFFVWLVNQCLSRMPRYADSYIVVYDFMGATLSNLSLDHLRNVVPVFTENFPERMSKVFVINSNWVMKFGWKVLRPLLGKATLEKI